MWEAAEVLAGAIAGLKAREAALREEQAVAGLDALEEVELHPVLSTGFAGAGWGVLREQFYPGQWRGRRGRRRLLPEDGERPRCDLVLTPRTGQVLADGLVSERDVETNRSERRGTLFEAAPEPAEVPRAERHLLSPEDAYWLEVKVVGQFAYVAGVPGPNGSYASSLVRGSVADLRKLGHDPLITRGGVLVVAFTADRATAEHDLTVLGHRCLDRGAPLRGPVVEGFPLTDRIGNCWCALWLAERSATGAEERAGEWRQEGEPEAGPGAAPAAPRGRAERPRLDL
jgi:hypothetical protein